MPTQEKHQYTVRGIPSDVDKALREKARRRGVSLNHLLVAELTSAAGLSAKRKRISLKGIVGGFETDAEFEQILEDQRQIDPEIWK